MCGGVIGVTQIDSAVAGGVGGVNGQRQIAAGVDRELADQRSRAAGRRAVDAHQRVLGVAAQVDVKGRRVPVGDGVARPAQGQRRSRQRGPVEHLKRASSGRAVEAERVAVPAVGRRHQFAGQQVVDQGELMRPERRGLAGAEVDHLWNVSQSHCQVRARVGFGGSESGVDAG